MNVVGTGRASPVNQPASVMLPLGSPGLPFPSIITAPSPRLPPFFLSILVYKPRRRLRENPRPRGDRPPDHGRRHRCRAHVSFTGAAETAAEELVRGGEQPGVPVGGGEWVRGRAGGQDPGEHGADAEAGHPRPRAERHPVRRLHGWQGPVAEEARGTGVHRRAGGQARCAVAGAEVAQVRCEPSSSSSCPIGILFGFLESRVLTRRMFRPCVF
jgi:hypothetical protein